MSNKKILIFNRLNIEFNVLQKTSILASKKTNKIYYKYILFEFQVKVITKMLSSRQAI